jgi:hypothetical protein
LKFRWRNLRRRRVVRAVFLRRSVAKPVFGMAGRVVSALVVVARVLEMIFVVIMLVVWQTKGIFPKVVLMVKFLRTC